ncbi:molecular chaperone [Salmonella enterica subsp. enterica]|uniref:Molecular chaperone n=1 Tax=Salmonella enterica I TaxID=59201 RepID=A0A379WXX4_SALET|nr:molecular chaperone [Salmonella enterica subsp. enterica]
MMPWTTPFSSILSISPNLWPSTARGLSGQSTLSTTSVTLVQHLALGYCGAAACRPGMAGSEPDNATPGYYYLAQRVFCGEGDSLLPELYAQWWGASFYQLDDLLLRWCRQHRPDFFPLLVMAVEGA